MTEKLTEEQRKKLTKLYRKFALNMLGVVLLYFAFLTFADLAITLLGKVYAHNPQITFLALVGTAVIGISGMVGTIGERREYFEKEAKAIVSSKSE
jgi:hypothetical protein